jgi:hypothetical protein
MKADGKKDSKPTRPDSLARPFLPGEAIPAPEVVEKNSDSSWALFQALQEEFAPTHRTGPAGLDSPGGLDSTQRDPLPPAAAAPAASLAAPTREQVMFEARRNNRVCPQPAFWNRLCQLLQKETGQVPPPPVAPAAWADTPSLSKRIALRAQVEWAAAHGALLPMYAYFRLLPEDKWHHMGD